MVKCCIVFKRRLLSTHTPRVCVCVCVCARAFRGHYSILIILLIIIVINYIINPANIRMFLGLIILFNNNINILILLILTQII